MPIPAIVIKKEDKVLRQSSSHAILCFCKHKIRRPV
jgi:hypothetical protein